MSDTVKNFKQGVFWSLGGRLSYLIISFGVNIVFARLLPPEEFGIIAIAFFFMGITQVLTESGLAGALVRKVDTTPEDYSTVFIFNLFMSTLLYLILYLISPQIEYFYNIDNLSLYIRVIGIILFIDAFRIIQKAKLTKDLDFKSISMIELISVASASVISIVMAIMGWGIWALITMQVTNALLITILFWIKKGGLDVYSFNNSSFKSLYKFGVFTTLANLLDTFFDNLYQLILGKYFNLVQTGFYFQSKKLTEVSVSMLRNLSDGVVFATLAGIQQDRDRFDSAYCNIIRILVVVSGFISLSIFIYAREILFLTYGEKWLGAVFYLKLLAVAYFFYILEKFNINLYKVFDKTHLMLMIEIIKRTIILSSLFIGVYFKDIKFLMFGLLITYIVGYLIYFSVSRRIHNSDKTVMEIFYVIKTVSVSILIALLMELNTFFYEDSIIKTIYFIPVVILLYLGILQLLRVINIKRDFSFLMSLKRTRL